MKLLITLLILFCASFAGAEQTDVAEVTTKYEVTFTVKYNSVSALRAAEISKNILLRHGNACKVDVKIKKVGNLVDGNGNTVTWTYLLETVQGD
jgi:hypothetical protein